MQTRSTVTARKAAIASSHQLASFNGAAVVKNGGNLFDALITTSSVLAVVQNNLCGLGGDMFALIRGQDGNVMNLNGSGRSSVNATIDLYEDRNLDQVPARGPLAAITVPGMVSAWGEIHRKYCTMELSELLKPAIDIAQNGVYLTRKYAESVRITAQYMHDQPGWKSLFTPGGDIPGEGDLLKQKLLAETLRTIASDGTDTFYRGDLMEKIVKGAAEQDCIFEESDFSRHSSTWNTPIKTNYRGTDIYETYPNSQGATVILWLNLLQNYESEILSGEDCLSVPVFLRSGLRAYLARAKYITDPEFQDLPHGFASMQFAEQVMNSDPTEWAAPAGSEDRGDTTYFCLADGDGNSASVIQSNYMGFGSGVSPTGTGFIFQNRGSYFSLDRKHHNRLEPNKRTFHTLCAAMGIEDGETSFVAGTMGGDIQPQINVQMISRLVDRKMDVQDMLDYPRWAFHSTIYEKPSLLLAEEPLAGKLSGVDLAGLSLESVGGLSSRFGHAQAIVLGKKGGIFAGADPRGDGSAAGF